ncbi:HVA22-like protein j [Ceratobasidium theobromae]|uniref:Protein YOP1 n=1 Tax=Ceratobasidium theobromae TaxID=1582974 RepID=A0A5N5QHX1_9AGAM|nr:HVA22-like protein j [Ceratobasidium theobromae]
MFFHLTRLSSVIYVFLYPGYGIYKTLTKRPLNTEEEQAQAAEFKRWLEYWSVIAFVLSAEYIAEWLVSWFPGYWLFKSIFLIWLVAPQTQGATFVFQHLLAPYLAKHEADIDARLANLNSSVIAYFQDQLGQLLATILPSVTGQTQQQHSNTAQANFAAGMMLSLLQQYAPSVLARGQHHSTSPKSSGCEIRPEPALAPVPVAVAVAAAS